jgi:hypothetical protein
MIRVSEERPKTSLWAGSCRENTTQYDRPSAADHASHGEAIDGEIDTDRGTRGVCGTACGEGGRCVLDCERLSPKGYTHLPSSAVPLTHHAP